MTSTPSTLGRLLTTWTMSALVLVSLAFGAEDKTADGAPAPWLVKEMSEGLRAGDRKRWFTARDSLKAQRESAVPPLLEALQDPDPWTRIAAVIALEELGPEGVRAVPLLIEVAHTDPVVAVRAKALVTLSVVGPERADEVRPVLVAALEDHEPQVREYAIDSLNVLGILARDSIPAIIGRIDDPDETVHGKAAAIHALVAIAPDSRIVLQKLIQLLEDEDNGHCALDALGALGPKAAPAVPAVIRLLKVEDQYGNSTAAETLGRIGPGARAAIPHLIACLRHENWLLCDASAEALGEIGPLTEDVVPALIEAVRDEKRRCSAEAAIALGRIGPAAKDAVPALVEALRAEDFPGWRRAFAKGLGGIGVGSKEVVAALSEALEKPEQEGVAQREAAEALGYIAKNYPGAVPVLTRALKHPNAQVRLKAAAALAALGHIDKPTLDTLIALLDHPQDNWATQENAAIALGNAGPQARAAIPALLAAMRHGDAYFRIHAVEAVGKIAEPERPVLDALKGALKDDDEAVRFHAAEVLARQGYVDEGVLAELTWHLRNGYMRLSAAEALGKMGAKAKSAIPALKIAHRSATTIAFRDAVARAIENIAD